MHRSLQYHNQILKVTVNRSFSVWPEYCYFNSFLTEDIMREKLAYLLALAILLGGVAKTSADLVGYWPLNGDALDAGENGLHGTLVGDVVPIEDRNGNPNAAMLFTGEADCYVDLGDREELRITGAMTLAAWLRLDSGNTNNGRIIAKQAGGGSRSWSLNIEANSGGVTNPGTFQIASNGNTIVGINDRDPLPTDEWVHLAGVYKPSEALELYVNGELKIRNISGIPATQFSDNGNSVLIGSRHAASNCGWMGAIDEVQIYNIALTPAEIKNLMSRRLLSFPKARVPSPKDGALHTDTWANLSWSPGDFAVSHDVYIGDNFDDVSAGAESTFVGNQAATFIVVGFPGFPFPDGLVPGTTYYWRVDEVNEAEPNSPWKGDIWSFNIPPKTAYFPDPADGAESVGLDVTLSWTEGFGSKLHTVYFGENLDDVSDAEGGLPQGTATYNPGTLKLAKTYYWRVDEFDIIETYKGDVWSFTTEGAVANPDPANGAMDVKQTQIITWSPSVFAASHELYFGTDKDAVKNADTSSPEYKGTRALGSETYDPGKLEWDSTYYWRIDEVNNANTDSPWTGPLWSFTTANFLVVDDFEDYDIGNNEIWWTWKDGIGYASHPTLPPYPGNGTGSMVGDETTGSYTEETIVHGGNQSMSVFYDNSILRYSEVEMTLTYPRDWTENGVSTLTIWFRGISDNAAETLYVALNGSAVVNHDNPNAAQIATWTEWRIDLQDFAAQGVNLANVNTITIGFGDKNNLQAGGSGMVFFDDIRLYRPAP